MPAERGSETLYLVDAYSLIFQVFHALPEMTSPAGLPTNALFGFTKDMLFLRNQQKPTYLVCCFDAPGPTFRDKVKIFNLRKREVFDAETLKIDWGIRPEQVIDYQTLVGDSVDNVRGVDGVGPKTASKYLQDYGTVENLIAHIDDLKGKKKENLQAFLPDLERSRKLVTLDTHVPIELDWQNWRLRDW